MRTPWVLGLGCLLSLGSPTTTVGQAPDTAEITVGVRPDRVRVGDPFTVTVRVVAEVWPTQVELVPGPAAELLETADRSSTGLGKNGTTRHVFERDFHLIARVPGRLSIPNALVELYGALIERPVPAVEATGAGLDWGPPPGGASRRPVEAPVRSDGVPPDSRGRDWNRSNSPYGVPDGYGPGVPYAPCGTYAFGAPPYAATPYGAQPYGAQPYGAQPYGAGSPDPFGACAPGGYGYTGSPWGGLPPGEGWAETADSDPYWVEMIPELLRYQTFADDPSGLASLQSGATPERVYVGQQVTVVTSAVFPPEAAYEMGSYPRYVPPRALGALPVDLPYAPPTAEARDGRAQEAHTYARAFFPTKAGALTVTPSSIQIPAAGAPMGAPPGQTLATAALTVEVLAIPNAEAPSGWTGAVGRYRVRAWLSAERVRWGEPALLVVEIAGAGHLPSQPRPDPGPVWGGGLRPLGDRAWMEVRDGVVGGVRRFTWLVVPAEDGLIRLGPVIFTFFDPWVGAFAQVESDELALEVLPIT